MRLIRFGVSMEASLLERFDALIGRNGEVNRSEAVRDLVRARLIEEDAADPRQLAFGVLTLVYEHEHSELQDRMVTLQHEHLHEIITTTHVHIDHHNCLEVILMKGRAGALRQLAAALGSYRGVKHSDLVLTTVAGNGAVHDGAAGEGRP